MELISRETIDEILLRTDIETLIGGYVTLKRAGSNLKGLCPFHSEKTPSFTVFPADNSFYCFGCGVGGSAITFVRQIEHMDYPDAVEFLAKRAGITVVRDEKDNGYEYKKVDKSRVLAMNVDAAKYFHRALFANTPGAQAALEYFTQKRGLSLSTIKHFGLGYAPDSFSEFSTFMRSRGYTNEELAIGFLVTKSDKGHYYDAFRNRVMFPIIDVSGNVIAFGGRVMDDSVPKYKNSSDTPVFKKSRNLFALNFARHTCGESLILCEGYMDVIALHAAGFTNAVATLGTAITAEQARVMSRYTKRVIISYDADEAGKKAATRAMKLLEEVGLEVKALTIPGAKDPDEYIKKFGKEKFASVLSSSKSKFEYNMDAILSKYEISLPQDKINALNEIQKMISEVYSAAERDIYIKNVTKRFDVSEKSIKSDVDRMIKKAVGAYKKTEMQRVHQKTVGYSDRINPSYIKAPVVARNEENVLGLLLVYPEHRKKVFNERLLSSDDFFTDLNREIFISIKCQYESGNSALEFDDSFSPEQIGRMTKMKLARMDLGDNGEAVLLESIASLKNSVLSNSLKETNTYQGLDALLSKIREN